MQTSTAIAGTMSARRRITARAGQSLLFLLTILLAGMLLSQLIEEKSNKIIEVLAAAVPIDAIFLGKLFAMLAASLVGIAVWVGGRRGGDRRTSSTGGLAALPPPAVGWPAFLAARRRLFRDELSAARRGLPRHRRPGLDAARGADPVDAGHHGAGRDLRRRLDRGRRAGQHSALAAAAFPLSSPYVMIARAAELPEHLAAPRRARLAIAVGRADPAPRREHVPPERAQVRAGAAKRPQSRSEPRPAPPRACSLQPRLHRHERERPVADPGDPGAGPLPPARPSGPGASR